MQIHSLQVGPIGTNCYLLCDENARACAVVDPGGDAGSISMNQTQMRGRWNLRMKIFSTFLIFCQKIR